MVIKPYSNEELWSPEPYQLPKRSRLNHLIPVAVNTPMVECMTSYLTRLAESHSISTSILMTREFAPLLTKYYIQNGSKKGLSTVFNRGAAINSTGELAQLFVNSAEKLTLEQNLSALTLLPFRNFLSSRELLHKTKAWCPDCYDQWRESAQTIYEPLIWTLKDVEVCPNHNRPLQTICLSCERHIPWLHSKSRNGYCPYCDSWLGSFNKTETKSDLITLSNKLEKKLWKYESVAELITKAGKNSLEIQQNNIVKAIREIIDISHQGNIASFAKDFNFPKNTVWMWYQGKSLPQLKFILEICYCLDISLLSFLQLEKSAFQLLDVNCQKLTKTVRVKRVSPKDFNLEKIETALQMILSSPHIPPLTMKEVAEKLGFDRRIVSEHCPELCKAISAKYLLYQNQIRTTKIDECCQEVRQAVTNLIKKGEYPSEARVSRLISQPGYFRYKKVRMALKDAKSKQNF